MKDYKSIALLAAKVGKEAGELLKSGFRKDHNIIHKGTVDLVTEMDLAAEKLIKARLAEALPDIHFFGEEEGGSDWKGNSVWIVDPLDGTTNYANGLEHFCVSIAYCENGIPKAAALVRPMSNDIYHCWKDGGAYLNGNDIHVTNETIMNQALAVTGFPYNRRECMDELLERLRIMLNHVQGVRRFGSAALDLCSIAQGLLSIFWETNLKPWDVAAGVLLVEEAGGQITKFDGTRMSLDTGELLATNKKLHLEVVKLLASDTNL